MPETSYHHGQLRPALLEAALALEPDHGPLGVSLREVARRAGVSHAAVYHHFPSKEALIVAVAAQGYAGLCDALAAPSKWASAGQPMLDLIALGQRYLVYALESPSRFRFMFGVSPGAESALAADQDRLLEIVAGWIRAAQDRGSLRPGDPRRFAAQLWAIVHGVASLSIGDALDGVQRGRREKQSAGARTRRAKDVMQGAVAAWLQGVTAPGSTWQGHGAEP